jgi:hypothetical protein
MKNKLNKHSLIILTGIIIIICILLIKKRGIVKRYNEAKLYTININFKNLDSFQNDVDRIRNLTPNPTKKYWGPRGKFKATVEIEGEKKIKSKIRVLGGFRDHWKTEKVSLMIKSKKENALGHLKHSLTNPVTRGFLGDWIMYKIEEKLNVLSLERNYYNVNINNERKGVFFYEEYPHKAFLKRNKIKNGSIFRVYFNADSSYNVDWSVISSDTNKVHNAIQSILIGDSVVHLDYLKFAYYYAITDLGQGFHQLAPVNVHIVYNEEKNILYPIGNEWECSYFLGEPFQTCKNFITKPYYSKYSIHKFIYHNSKIRGHLYEAYEKIVKLNIESLIKENIDFINTIEGCLIYDLGANKKYNFQYLFDNQEKIKNMCLAN